MANDSPWRKAFFLEDPDCPTLVVMEQQQVVEQKCPAPARRKRRLVILVYIIYYFIFILIYYYRISCEARTTPEDARRMRQAHHACVGPGITH